MYPCQIFDIPYKGTDIIEPLTASAELDDFIWLLDQCGFDEHVRAMPHKHIFAEMRGHLLGRTYDWGSGIEHQILMKFTRVEDYKFTPYSGHAVSKHLLECLWRSIHDVYSKVNLIDYKINRIVQGSAPIFPVKALALPAEVISEGSRVALLLMLKLPAEFKNDYLVWAQKQALFEHLHALRPNHSFVKEKLDENASQFESLYKSANRRTRRDLGSALSNSGEVADFYKSLHKYRYGKKCSIIRCLLEADLAA